MGEVTTLEMVRGLYEYHWWANRRLFDVAAALGDEACGQALGGAFSFPTLRATFTHIYGVEGAWLARWQGRTPVRVPESEFTELAALRSQWDVLEADQAAFISALHPPDLERVVEFTSMVYPRPDGEPYRIPLWPLLQHVANHATHHRSEIATMLTMIKGSPPATDLALYYFRGQGFTG